MRPDGVVVLTSEEQQLLDAITFDVAGVEDHARVLQTLSAAAALTKRLLARGAVPEVRWRYFTDPDLNVGGRGKSPP